MNAYHPQVSTWKHCLCVNAYHSQVSTWKHLRMRRAPASVFRHISAQLAAYEAQGQGTGGTGSQGTGGTGYDFDAIHRIPDTFCMGWRTTPLSRAFSCRLGMHVCMHACACAALVARPEP